MAGEVELTLGRSLNVSQAAQIQDRRTGGNIGVGFKNFIVVNIQFLNPNPSLLLDVQFRRTLIHAVNRQELSDALENGWAPVAHTFLSPRESLYRDIEPYIVKYDYDPLRSIQIAEGLGYTRGGDGMFRDPSAQSISLEVRTNPGHEELIFAIADQLRVTGFDAKPYVISDAQRRDLEYNATFPALRLWRTPNDPADVARYHSRTTPLPETRFVGGNNSRYRNSAVDALIDRYFSTMAASERVPIMGEIIRHLTDQVNQIPIYYNIEPVLIGKRVIGVGPRETGKVTEAWNAHEWDVK